MHKRKRRKGKKKKREKKGQFVVQANKFRKYYPPRYLLYRMSRSLAPGGSLLKPLVIFIPSQPIQKLRPEASFGALFSKSANL